MKTINIFLDDERQPIYVKNKLGSLYPENWVVINNYFDFTDFIDKNLDNLDLQEIKDNFEKKRIIEFKSNKKKYNYDKGIFNKDKEGNIGESLIEEINNFLEYFLWKIILK
mgnify:CR=1 FL=1